jgi:carbon-monoxide dehydrogenase medium subunit
VKPPDFDYASPDALEDVFALLRGSADAKVLAGGQSLIPLLNFRLAAPALLVDLRRVRGLEGVERADATIHIGAMVRQRAAESNALLKETVPLLVEALRHVAHPQIRSRGTVGGSIAHADPAAELPAVLVALDGRIRVESANGGRWIDARDVYAGFLTTSLDPDEVLTLVELPMAPSRTGAACVEVARRNGDYALCGTLVQVTLSGDGAVDDVRIALLGVGQTPRRATAVESVLRGEMPISAKVAEAAAEAAEGLEPADEPQASAAFRRHLARVLVRRALELAIGRAA